MRILGEVAPDNGVTGRRFPAHPRGSSGRLGGPAGRPLRRAAAGLLIGWAAALAASVAHAAPKMPYEGLWADSEKACRDPDGVDRLEITGRRFFWYETRCLASAIAPAGANAWRMRMACEGEGQRFRARPRLTLTAPDQLVMDGSPVGPTRHQVYRRCQTR